MVHRTRNATLQVPQGIHTQEKSGENIRHSKIPPKKFNMPHMFPMDVTFHATQDLSYALQNPELAIPLVKLGNGNN